MFREKSGHFLKTLLEASRAGTGSVPSQKRRNKKRKSLGINWGTAEFADEFRGGSKTERGKSVGEPCELIRGSGGY